MKIQTKCWILLFALVSAALGLVGCGGYYSASAYPGYGPYAGGYGGGPQSYSVGNAFTDRVRITEREKSKPFTHPFPCMRVPPHR